MRSERNKDQRSLWSEDPDVKICEKDFCNREAISLLNNK